MADRLCDCGRGIPRPFNSTIYPKKCPSCLTIDKNRSLLRQSVSSGGKVPKTGFKTAKSKNFNIYKTTAWKYCSHYVLLFYADKNGFVKCSTSGRTYHITSSKIHCGHYIKTRDMSKTNYSVAFDFENLAPQSMADNTYGGGRQDEMRIWLIEKHGVKSIEALEIKKHNTCHLDKVTLDIWADHYKKLFNELLRERNLKNPWS